MELWVESSVSRWLDHVFNRWPSSTMKICSMPFFVKVGSKFCQIVNIPSKNAKYLTILSKWQKIWPNLVALVVSVWQGKE